MWPNVVSSERKWSTEKLFLYSLFLCKPWQENHYTLKIQFILPAMVGILHLFENFPLFLAEIKKKGKKAGMETNLRQRQSEHWLCRKCKGYRIYASRESVKWMK